MTDSKPVDFAQTLKELETAIRNEEVEKATLTRQEGELVESISTKEKELQDKYGVTLDAADTEVAKLNSEMGAGVAKLLKELGK